MTAQEMQKKLKLSAAVLAFMCTALALVLTDKRVSVFFLWSKII